MKTICSNDSSLTVLWTIPSHIEFFLSHWELIVELNTVFCYVFSRSQARTLLSFCRPVNAQRGGNGEDQDTDETAPLNVPRAAPVPNLSHIQPCNTFTSFTLDHDRPYRQASVSCANQYLSTTWRIGLLTVSSIMYGYWFRRIQLAFYLAFESRTRTHFVALDCAS